MDVAQDLDAILESILKDFLAPFFSFLKKLHGGPNSLADLPDFRFETTLDGLSTSDSDSTQNLVALCKVLLLKK